MIYFPLVKKIDQKIFWKKKKTVKVWKNGGKNVLKKLIKKFFEQKKTVKSVKKWRQKCIEYEWWQ